jgi:hypothetical protein
MLPDDDQPQLAHRGPALPINGTGTPTGRCERDYLSTSALGRQPTRHDGTFQLGLWADTFPRKRLVKFCTKRFRGNAADIVVSAAGVGARHRPGERDTIGSVATTRALTQGLGRDGVPGRRPCGAGHHLPASDVRRAGTTLRLRYCWSSELDLLVRLAGLRLRERYQDWHRGLFTGES